MKIDNQQSFEHALKTGINFFLGAGFSLLAKDSTDKNLPTGGDLTKELSEHFKKTNTFTLPQLSTILEATSKEEFYNYLTQRFTVKYIDPLYYNLLNVKIKSIYTTNIDDLIPNIFKKNPSLFLNDQYNNGPTTDNNGVNYLPLHGNVSIVPHKYIFDVASLANIFNDVNRIWNCLARELETHPTVFIGYGFNDSSVIQALTSQKTFENAKKKIWVVLREADEVYKEFYKSLGFNTIFSDTKKFLQYLNNFSDGKITKNIEEDKIQLLKPYLVPKSIYDIEYQRPILDFYSGGEPTWSDILANQLYKTHHLDVIINSIYTPNKNTIIIGGPVTGKSTLLKQAAIEVHDIGLKLFFDSLSKERAEFIMKIVGKDKAVIFIDNLYDSIDAIDFLEKKNVKIVASERSHYFGIISHYIDSTKYNIINVTTLNDIDLQGIFNKLPNNIRKTYLSREYNLTEYEQDSVFEFVIRNVTLQNVKDRYGKALKQLEIDDIDLAEFITLCAYMHSCHIPLSSEMAFDYFNYENFEDVFYLRQDAKDIIKDFIPIKEDKFLDMDYYYPRSLYVAETILDAASSQLVRKVMKTVIKNIPPFKICDYRIFRKYAFDKVFANKAFTNYYEGQEYYKEAFLYDRENPYVLQQGALYMAQKKQFDIAFNWIDRAITMTNDKYFSIRNSHAIILFSANIDKKNNLSKKELDRSMTILEKCMTADSRKRFHAITYGQQAIRYFNFYKDETAKKYLGQAQIWIQSEMRNNKWDNEMGKILNEIRNILNSI